MSSSAEVLTYVCEKCSAGWPDWFAGDTCPHCGDDAILRGRYRVIDLET